MVLFYRRIASYFRRKLFWSRIVSPLAPFSQPMSGPTAVTSALSSCLSLVIFDIGGGQS